MVYFLTFFANCIYLMSFVYRHLSTGGLKSAKRFLESYNLILSSIHEALMTPSSIRKGMRSRNSMKGMRLMIAFILVAFIFGNTVSNPRETILLDLPPHVNEESIDGLVAQCVRKFIRTLVCYSTNLFPRYEYVE